jgi:hypothetical protein
LWLQVAAREGKLASGRAMAFLCAVMLRIGAACCVDGAVVRANVRVT